MYLTHNVFDFELPYAKNVATIYRVLVLNLYLDI